MGRSLNLINQKFTKLLVEEKTELRKGTSVVQKCKCDCGNITYASTSELNSQHKQSCGCLQKESAKIIGTSKGCNLINQVFNELKVLEKTEQRKDGKIVWKCICSCGEITYASTTDLKQGRKKHCEKCANIKSLGEEKIKKILKENNIFYVKEKTFNDLKGLTGRPLRFDFYVDNKYLIEFDGKQHFIEDSGYGADLINIQKRDKIKNEYCFKNNIPLIRIPYSFLNTLSIKDLLLNSSNFIVKEDEKNE